MTPKLPLRFRRGRLPRDRAVELARWVETLYFEGFSFFEALDVVVRSQIEGPYCIPTKTLKDVRARRKN